MDDRIDLSQYIADLRSLDGKELEVFERLRMPQGWVVTSQVPQGFWEKCQTYAIPIRAKKRWGIFPSGATLEHADLVKRYGQEFVMALIPDDEVCVGYSRGPIFVADLDCDPYKLLDESLCLIGKDHRLSDAKRLAAMLLLGWSDTK